MMSDNDEILVLLLIIILSGIWVYSLIRIASILL